MVRDEIKSDYLGMLIDNMDSRFYWVWGEQLGKLVDLCYRQAPADPVSNLNKLRMCIIENKQDSVIYMCNRLAEVSRQAGDKENLVLALSTAGDMSYQMGDRREAYRYYDEALEVDPDCAPVLNNYAYYLSEEGRSLRKALKMSRRTIELEPDNATYLDTCGWILYLLGRPKEAKPLFKHAMLYGGKDSSVVLEHYSVILGELGEKDAFNILSLARGAEESTAAMKFIRIFLTVFLLLAAAAPSFSQDTREQESRRAALEKEIAQLEQQIAENISRSSSALNDLTLIRKQVETRKASWPKASARSG